MFDDRMPYYRHEMTAMWAALWGKKPVINGFSELMRDVFGEEHGLGARSAFGCVSLPAGWPVEIEAVFELRS